MASEQFLGKSEDGLGVEEDPYEHRKTEHCDSQLGYSQRKQNSPPLLIENVA